MIIIIIFFVFAFAFPFPLSYSHPTVLISCQVYQIASNLFPCFPLFSSSIPYPHSAEWCFSTETWPCSLSFLKSLVAAHFLRTKFTIFKMTYVRSCLTWLWHLSSSLMPLLPQIPGPSRLSSHTQLPSPRMLSLLLLHPYSSFRFQLEWHFVCVPLSDPVKLIRSHLITHVGHLVCGLLCCTCHSCNETFLYNVYTIYTTCLILSSFTEM